MIITKKLCRMLCEDEMNLSSLGQLYMLCLAQKHVATEYVDITGAETI